MISVGIIGNGPTELIPNLSKYRNQIDIWIGADRGAFVILENELELSDAIGDFDSVSNHELEMIKSSAQNFEQYPIEKDETDLELALRKAFSYQANTIYFFGVTGGRIDHTLINIQLLDQILHHGSRGIIIDAFNQIELFYPGTHKIGQDVEYPHISFIPFTKQVRGLTLSGFYYPLDKATIPIGSTRSISNRLITNSGTFSYDDGIVLVVRSRG